MILCATGFLEQVSEVLLTVLWRNFWNLRLSFSWKVSSASVLAVVILEVVVVVVDSSSGILVVPSTSSFPLMLVGVVVVVGTVFTSLTASVVTFSTRGIFLELLSGDVTEVGWILVG